MRLAQCRGQLVDLGLQLLLTTRGTGLTALGNPGPAALEELGLPPRHRLLRDLVPPSGLGDRHLPGQHAQHDPDLVLHRDHRGTAHRHTSCSGTYITPEPQSLTRDNRSHRVPTDGIFDLVANDDRGAIAADDGSTPAGHRPTSRVRLTVRVLTCLQAPVRYDA